MPTPQGVANDVTGTAQPARDSRRPPLARLLLRAAGLVLDAVLIGALVAVVFLGYGLIDNRWYHVVAVTGGSMAPTIAPGDVIVISRPPSHVEPGMVLTLEVDGAVVTHRVVETHADGTFVTKGDANDVRDDFTGHTVRIVGQYQLRIPFLGTVLGAGEPRHASGTGAWMAAQTDVHGQAIAGTWSEDELTVGTPSAERDGDSEGSGTTESATTSQPTPTADPATGLEPVTEETPSPTSATPTSEPQLGPDTTPTAGPPTTGEQSSPAPVVVWRPVPAPTTAPEVTPTPVAETTPAPEPTATPVPDPTTAPEATPTPIPETTPDPEPTATPVPDPTTAPEATPTPIPETTPDPELP